MNLQTGLSSIRGVGPKTADKFLAAGLVTVGDLISFLPRKHEDFSKVTPIEAIKPGKMTIRASCESISTRIVRRGIRITEATLIDESGKLKAVWFNQPYRAVQLKDADEEFFFSGQFEFRYNRYQLTSPSAERVSDMPVQTDRLLPVYPTIKGLKSQLVRKVLWELKPLMTMLPETLPSAIVEKQQLLSYSKALLGMHFLTGGVAVGRPVARLAFEEIFILVLASSLNKQANNKLDGWVIPFDDSVMRRAVSELPFKLTNAQRLALWQVVQDFEKVHPMNRLLQGDVGSGKTVVAGLAALQAKHAGFQTAIMAPTELLASQHANTLSSLLGAFNVTIGLATGSVTGKPREELYNQIADGQVDIIVGTHALFQDNMRFQKLGFVAIDEQHRFGVEQRQKLLLKSKKMPHLLAMTATPIPRSLALTVYGELDISLLKEMPKGRRNVETSIWKPSQRNKLYRAVDEQLEAGRQAYVVCRLIEDNPKNEQKSVRTEYDRIKHYLSNRKIGLMHGKLPSDEKRQTMEKFASGEIDILVSTTVVEVGVDVANATVMVIENADQFGLSQLHQLRGRVGRSSFQGYCFLVLGIDAEPTKRLREIEKSNDGFYLAEADLRLRGPGEIYGKSQHGQLNLKVASLADSKMIERAQMAVSQFKTDGYDILGYQTLAETVEYYQRLTTLN